MRPKSPLQFLFLLLSCAFLLAGTSGCISAAPDSSPDSSGVSAETSRSDQSGAASSDGPDSSAQASGASKPPATSSQKPPSSAQVKSQTPVSSAPKAEYPSKNKTSVIGFGLYGVNPDGGWTTTFDDFIQSDWCNTFFVGPDKDGMTEALQKAKEHRSQIFVSVGGHLWRHFGGTAKLIDRWQEELQSIVQMAKDSGAYGAFAGFYMDEPLLAGVTHEDLLKATRYMREISGNKRVFVCFALSGIAPEEWTTPTASPPITAETGKYLTDVAFDVYGTFDREVFASRTQKMLNRLGNRSDVRVWYVPPVMNSGGKHTEQNSIDFMNGVLNLLKQQSNPGGIMGYSYAVALSETDTLGNIGLGDLLKPGMKDGWFKLFDHIKQVGRDICSKKTFGK